MIESFLPDPLVGTRLFHLALWRWATMILLAAIAWAASWMVVAVLSRVAQRLAARSATRIDDALLAVLAGPARAGIALAVFAPGVVTLGLPARMLAPVTTLEKIGIILVVAWVTLRVEDVFATVVAERLAAPGQAAALRWPSRRRPCTWDRTAASTRRRAGPPRLGGGLPADPRPVCAAAD